MKSLIKAKVLIAMISCWMCAWPLYAQQATDDEIRLFDNRFRVDPTISQVVFMIHREAGSKSVVLVRPDGSKVYFDRHPKNMSWLQKEYVDVITVENPMPGPWQAIGKISADNKIAVLSDLTMKLDNLPKQLYQAEMIKFTAALFLKDKPLELSDFLKNIELQVSFTALFDELSQLPPEQMPPPSLVGTFLDDGTELDEKPSDGVFTLALAIDEIPGRYRVEVVSKNALFIRAIEQEVLIYPTPILINLQQKTAQDGNNLLLIESDVDNLEPGSLAVHAEFSGPDNQEYVYEQKAPANETKLSIQLDDFALPGSYQWHARVYATEKGSGRDLVFAFDHQSFTVVDFAAIEKANQERAARDAKRAQLVEQQRLAAEQQSEQQTLWYFIIAGNLLLLLLGVVVVIAIKNRREAKELGL